jgi:hypothetical protein
MRVEANRRFQDPWVALQVAGFRRDPVQIKGVGNDDLIRLKSSVAMREKEMLVTTKTCACQKRAHIN